MKQMIVGKEYVTFGRRIHTESGVEAEIRIDFYDVPEKKQSQIEKAARNFLNLAGGILNENQPS